MPRLKVLSGKKLVDILSEFGFHIVEQSGSHVKLRKQSAFGEKQTLLVPLHKEIDKGLMRAIFKQASAYIPEQDLKKHFYNN